MRMFVKEFLAVQPLFKNWPRMVFRTQYEKFGKWYGLVAYWVQSSPIIINSECTSVRDLNLYSINCGNPAAVDARTNNFSYWVRKTMTFGQFLKSGCTGK